MKIPGGRCIGYRGYLSGITSYAFGRARLLVEDGVEQDEIYRVVTRECKAKVLALPPWKVMQLAKENEWVIDPGRHKGYPAYYIMCLRVSLTNVTSLVQVIIKTELKNQKPLQADQLTGNAPKEE